MKRVICFIAALSFGSFASADTSLTPELTPAAIALSNAFSAKNTGDWDGALAIASPAGPVAVDLIEWQRLRAGQGSFDAALDFLKRRPDWPGLPLLRKRSEKTILVGANADQVIGFFKTQRPRTLKGSLRYAEALNSSGQSEAARQEIQRGWVSFAGTAEIEEDIKSGFGSDVRDLNEKRLEAMLWAGETSAAERALPNVSLNAAALARARLDLQKRADSVDASIAAVPDGLANDAGLAHDRFQWRMSKRLWADAEELIMDRSNSATSLGMPEKWASQRIRLARDRMGDERHLAAYRLAANHYLKSGSQFAELEFLAGYLSLRKLNRPDVALYHFQRHGTVVTSPISLGRSHYWQGRAYEALNKPEAAKAAYNNGAKYQTGFYGLLSAEKAGVPLDPKLTGAETFAGGPEAAFTSSSVYQAAQILLDAGQKRIGVRFLAHQAESLSRTEIGQMTTLAEQAGLPEVALLIAKRGVQYGAVIERAYYPLHPLTENVRGIPIEMALSISRRESEFFQDARSGVGALGLMQLMPATAREVAGELGIGFSESRLTSDPNYNAQLGAGYLAKLYKQFGNSPVQIAAAYNAGPSRPIRWMKERGDPRRGQVDVIDWIEEIPFSETRNYVMRVTEVLPIYKARLTGQTGALEFTKLLNGSYVAPPKPLAPTSSIRPLARPDVPATE